MQMKPIFFFQLSDKNNLPSFVVGILEEGRRKKMKYSNTRFYSGSEDSYIHFEGLQISIHLRGNEIQELMVR